MGRFQSFNFSPEAGTSADDRVGCGEGGARGGEKRSDFRYATGEGAGEGEGEGEGERGRRSGAMGRVRVKVAPEPSPSLAAERLPPISFAARTLLWSPKPCPSFFVVKPWAKMRVS